MRTMPVLFFFSLCFAGCVSTNSFNRENPFDRDRPSYCVPLPSTPTRDLRRLTPTATPNPASYTPVPAMNWPTVTPLPIAHNINLSPQLSPEETMDVLVYRCDGTWDTYRMAPTLFPGAIPYSQGDIIYMANPSVRPHPPEPPTITPTANKP